MNITQMISGGLFLFLGPDRARKLQRIQELERTLKVSPLDRHALDAAVTPADELVALCRQQPLDSPVRLIVVDQAHRLEASCVEALGHHAAVIARTACLILLVDTELSLRHALTRWLPPSEAGRGTGEGIAVERFAGRDIAAVKPFALTDALGTRHVAGALSAVHDQRLSGKEPLELLGLVAWQLQRWVTVRRLVDLGCSPAHIGRATGLKPWQVQRVTSEVNRRSLGSLQRLLQRCWQLDVEAKSGRAMPELAVEQLVIEVCLNSGEARVPQRVEC